MGIILTTISTFFNILNTLFMIINFISISSLIIFIVYIGPKIKGIFDGYTAYQEITAKLSEGTGNECLTQNELEDFKNKIDTAKNNMEQLKSLPVIGGAIPPNINTMFDEIINNINNIPICQ